MSKEELRIIITGGGTGGHLFPGIAVAQEIKRRNPEARILFAGTGRAVDREGLARYGFEARTMHCGALKGAGIMGMLRTMWGLPMSLLEALRLLREFKPALVFGVGGYVTGPVIAAARLLGIPTAIHEQNSVPGLANRQLGRVARRVFLSIPGTERYFRFRKCYFSGNPVREEIIKAAAGPPSGEPVLLIIGGSQGAHCLNTLLPEAVGGILTELPAGFRVIHQTGKEDELRSREAWKKLRVEAEVRAFFKDMARIYSPASLVVSRAGATTLAELTVLGKAAVLIPFPFAADNHQQKNADYLVAAGAARMFKERDLSPAALGRAIVEILNNNESRREMEKQARQLARPEAAAAIVDECEKLIVSR